MPDTKSFFFIFVAPLVATVAVANSDMRGFSQEEEEMNQNLATGQGGRPV